MCNVGLHRMCYEEYKDKPFHELRINKFLCKPCLILGTEVQTEEEDGKIIADLEITIFYYSHMYLI